MDNPNKAGTMKTKSKSMLSPKGKAAMMKVKRSKNMPPAMKRALIKKIMASESAKSGGAKMTTGKGKQKQALSQLFSTMNQS